MRFVFRVDASIEIGTGHVIRCLTFAETLKEQGYNVSFVCREHEGHLCDLIEEKGHSVYRLTRIESENSASSFKNYENWVGTSPERDALETITVLSKLQADWLIVDHYGIDKYWETIVRPFVQRILVIDDLANREHNSDVLLDPNYYENMEERYSLLIPQQCKLLLGPKYALLRPEFRRARERLRKRDGVIRRILVFFGGTDPTNETYKVLQAINLLNRPDIKVDVVVGSTNPNKDMIRKICESMSNVFFHCQVNYMAQLMVQADLAIGAGGSTTWERCSLGLPSLVITIADNQLDSAQALHKLGVLRVLGSYSSTTIDKIVQTVNELLQSREVLREMENKSLQFMNVHHRSLLLNILGCLK